MFERFTAEARAAMVAAQAAARELNHNYIGTEHILLGLFHGERDTVTRRSLQLMRVTRSGVKRKVIERIGEGQFLPEGHIPFTPRGKKVLEYALREALQLDHHYVGAEHLLLALIREGEGVGPLILAEHSGLVEARDVVMDELAAPPVTLKQENDFMRRRIAFLENQLFKHGITV